MQMLGLGIYVPGTTKSQDLYWVLGEGRWGNYNVTQLEEHTCPV